MAGEVSWFYCDNAHHGAVYVGHIDWMCYSVGAITAIAAEAVPDAAVWSLYDTEVFVVAVAGGLRVATLMGHLAAAPAGLRVRTPAGKVATAGALRAHSSSVGV